MRSESAGAFRAGSQCRMGCRVDMRTAAASTFVLSAAGVLTYPNLADYVWTGEGKIRRRTAATGGKPDGLYSARLGDHSECQMCLCSCLQEEVTSVVCLRTFY